MKIESKFQKKKPVLSFEIFPPKRDKAIQNIDETLAILSELNPDFISVTFGAGGSHTDNQTVELAKRIKVFKTPELHFEYDESIERGMNISSLIDQANSEKPVQD